MAHFAEAEVMIKFNRPTKMMIPPIVSCGGIASERRKSAPETASRTPICDALNAYRNCAAKK